MVTDLVGPLLGAVLACATAALDPPASKAFINAGLLPPWDQCGGEACGQCWVRLVSLVPVGAAGVKPCGVTGWVVTVGVGVIRCVAGVDSRGNPPSGGAMTTDGLTMTADMSALIQAVMCCEVEPRTIERWTPLGAQGGCAGGEWTVTYRTGTCGCP